MEEERRKLVVEKLTRPGYSFFKALYPNVFTQGQLMIRLTSTLPNHHPPSLLPVSSFYTPSPLPLTLLP